MHDRPIAVFDSGLGGLTVVRALQRHLPAESIIYFGDTARVPYGTKSSRTVLQFAEQDARFLLRFDPKLIVAACNTASALALSELRQRLSLPLLGVVEPGALEAVHQADGRAIAVLATESTVGSEAYRRAIQNVAPDTPVTQQACPSLVALIEEGRDGRDPIMRLILEEYLAGIRPLAPAVVVLGCTHYPLVADAVSELMADSRVVDSAEATARAVRDQLEKLDVLSDPTRTGTLHCYVSDNPQRFREVGGRFLGRPIRDVTWITPEQFFDEDTVHPAAGKTPQSGAA